jgi:uncharacterized membrane protein YuzA (DUF378 family)
MKHSTGTYLRAKMNMVIAAIVIIGALNWGTTAFGYNLVEILNNFINRSLGYQSYVDKIIYIIVALSALKMMFNRNTWLPFLGYSAFPTQPFVPNKNNSMGNTIVKVTVKPNTRIAYWAALPKQSQDTPYVDEAYGKFENSGVVMSDINGVAELLILPGSEYTIPSGKVIDRHIHYRELDLPAGMMGRIETVYY